MFRDLPQEFRDNFLNEAAFDTTNSTFCIWRLRSDDRWHCGKPPVGSSTADDGSAALLEIFAGEPEQYVELAREYYEVELPLEAVAAVYRHAPLTQTLLDQLNPEIVRTELDVELKEIGYLEA